LAASRAAQTVADGDWPSSGRDPGGMRYSPLTQINRQYVAKLKVAF
jgi:quinoprotein glucose dehydrogenase